MNTPRCTAKHGRQIRCELPKGHDGDHAHGEPRFGGGTFTEMRIREATVERATEELRRRWDNAR